MIRAMAELRRWFAEHRIPTEGLTVILNFQDAMPAARFDAAVRHEFSGLMFRLDAKEAPRMGPVDRLLVMEIDVRVESPIHEVEPGRLLAPNE